MTISAPPAGRASACAYSSALAIAAAVLGASLAATAATLFSTAVQNANLALTAKVAADGARARQMALEKLLSAIKLIQSTAQQSPPLRLESPETVDRAAVLLQRLMALLRRQQTNKHAQVVLPDRRVLWSSSTASGREIAQSHAPILSFRSPKPESDGKSV